VRSEKELRNWRRPPRELISPAVLWLVSFLRFLAGRSGRRPRCGGGELVVVVGAEESDGEGGVKKRGG
jgi:hypothetical protein